MELRVWLFISVLRCRAWNVGMGSSPTSYMIKTLWSCLNINLGYAVKLCGLRGGAASGAHLARRAMEMGGLFVLEANNLLRITLLKSLSVLLARKRYSFTSSFRYTFCDLGALRSCGKTTRARQPTHQPAPGRSIHANFSVPCARPAGHQIPGRYPSFPGTTCASDSMRP